MQYIFLQAEEKLRLQALEIEREESQVRIVLELQAGELIKEEQQKIQHSKVNSKFKFKNFIREFEFELS
jgi:hypothetical protein